VQIKPRAGRQRVPGRGQRGGIRLGGPGAAAMLVLYAVVARGGTFDDGVAERAAEEQQRPFAVIDDLAHERLKQVIAGGQFRHRLLERGIARRAAHRAPRTATDAGLDHHVAVRMLRQGLSQIGVGNEAGGNDRHAQRLQLFQVALVAVPAQQGAVVDRGHAQRVEPVQPVLELRIVLEVVPHGADQHGVVARPVHGGVVPHAGRGVHAEACERGDGMRVVGVDAGMVGVGGKGKLDGHKNPLHGGRPCLEDRGPSVADRSVAAPLGPDCAAQIAGATGKHRAGDAWRAFFGVRGRLSIARAYAAPCTRLATEPNMPIDWTHAGATVLAAFLASLVECVEALTVVLAVGATRGWRSALAGSATGLLALLLLVVLLGHVLTRIPLHGFQLVVGALLLLFGMCWLRKAVLRAAGVLSLHDEEAIYQRKTQALRGQRGARPGLDKLAFAVTFKSIMLEGLEVVFIVLAIGAGRVELLWPASLGALAALLLVAVLGAVVHRPLARVPE